jgi:hypothetical protein
MHADIEEALNAIARLHGKQLAACEALRDLMLEMVRPWRGRLLDPARPEDALLAAWLGALCKAVLGIPLHTRVAVVEHLWTEDREREHLRFFGRIVQRMNNQQLHTSADALTGPSVVEAMQRSPTARAERRARGASALRSVLEVLVHPEVDPGSL